MNANPMGREMMKGWRMAACMVTCVGAVVIVILWLFFYAGGYNVYQNIAVVGAIFLVCMGVMAAVMAPWFMRQRATGVAVGSS